MGLFRTHLKFHLASLESLVSPCIPVRPLFKASSQVKVRNFFMLTSFDSENKLDEEQERLSFLRIKIQLDMVKKEEVSVGDWAKATNELEKYTVGNTRSVADFEAASGVDFKHGELSDLATSGNVPADMFADNVLASLLAGYLK